MRWSLQLKAILISLLIIITLANIGVILFKTGYFDEPEPYVPPDLRVSEGLISLEIDESISGREIFIQTFWDEENSMINGLTRNGWVCEEIVIGYGGPQIFNLTEGCVFDTPDIPHNVSITYCVFHQVPEGRIYFDLFPEQNSQAGCVTYYNFFIFTPHEYIHSSDGMNDADLRNPNGNLTISWNIIDYNNLK